MDDSNFCSILLFNGAFKPLMSGVNLKVRQYNLFEVRITRLKILYIFVFQIL